MRTPEEVKTLRFTVSMLVGAVLTLSGAAAAERRDFQAEPDPLRPRDRGLGRPVRVAEDAVHEQRLPGGWFDEVDYNSTRAVGDKSEVHQQIDDAIAGLKQRTGKSQVDVVAHSLGTSVMYDYLTNGAWPPSGARTSRTTSTSTARAENPGVPTLAVWAGRGTPGRNMAGAQNVTVPNQTHVQACTSAESFVAYYEFLTGSPPANDIVRQNGSIESPARRSTSR